MGYWASGTVCYGFDVTNQSPDWYDDENLDDWGEYGTGMMRDAGMDAPFYLHHDDFTGTVVLAAYVECFDNHVCEIDPPELPTNARELLEAAAELLAYDITGLEPKWLAWAKFS